MACTVRSADIVGEAVGSAERQMLIPAIPIVEFMDDELVE